MDLSPIIKALHAGLKADATLVAMLGSANEIYVDAIGSAKPAFPSLVLGVDDGPADDSAGEVVRASIETHVFAKSRWQAEAIKGRLDSAWTIPKKRPAGLLATGVRCSLLVRTGWHFAGLTQHVATDERIRHYVGLWKAQFIIRT